MGIYREFLLFWRDPCPLREPLKPRNPTLSDRNSRVQEQGIRRARNREHHLALQGTLAAPSGKEGANASEMSASIAHFFKGNDL
jgi:hypothetical protein